MSLDRKGAPFRVGAPTPQAAAPAAIIERRQAAPAAEQRLRRPHVSLVRVDGRRATKPAASNSNNHRIAGVSTVKFGENLGAGR